MAISHLSSRMKSLATNTERHARCGHFGPLRLSSRSAWSHGVHHGWQSIKRDEAVTMFGSLKTFISSLIEDARLQNRSENKDCWLATAALLIRVATVDSEMSEARRGKLHADITTRFGLDDRTT